MDIEGNLSIAAEVEVEADPDAKSEDGDRRTGVAGDREDVLAGGGALKKTDFEASAEACADDATQAEPAAHGCLDVELTVGLDEPAESHSGAEPGDAAADGGVECRA